MKRDNTIPPGMKEVWAMFASAALGMADGDSEKQCAEEAATIADHLLEEYRKRA